MNIDITYRSAIENDVPLILRYIKELAEYEELLHEVVATEDDIRATMFNDNPKAFAVIAEGDSIKELTKIIE